MSLDSNWYYDETRLILQRNDYFYVFDLGASSHSPFNEIIPCAGHYDKYNCELIPVEFVISVMPAIYFISDFPRKFIKHYPEWKKRTLVTQDVEELVK